MFTCSSMSTLHRESSFNPSALSSPLLSSPRPSGATPFVFRYTHRLHGASRKDYFSYLRRMHMKQPHVRPLSTSSPSRQPSNRETQQSKHSFPDEMSARQGKAGQGHLPQASRINTRISNTIGDR